MDIKDADRVVIAKPVASRPTCSSFRSFSELLAGAINASSPHACTETAVPAIRPKTVRFKPVVNCSQSAIVSRKAELSGNLVCVSSDKVSNSESKPTVLYKPQAMLVSKATVSLLANMGNFNTTHQQTQHLPEAPRIRNSNQDRQNFRTQVSSNHQSTPSHTETDQTSDFSKMVSQDTEKDPKSFPAAAVSDRPSYDGYNWRKYGQKQVKGSEYPRSYYKCTHPSCPVKKKVERSFDGQIAEIVYKGEHNHLKPQAPKRSSSGNQGLGLPSEVVAQENSNSLWSNHHSERNEGWEGKVDNQNEVGILAHSSYPSKGQLPYQPVPTRKVLAGAAASDNSVGLGVEYEEGNKDGEDNEKRSKRRKVEHRSSEVGISSDVLQEPRLTVQSSADPEIMSDGFRWRKYGQKIVKGSSYPRSYYRCTSLKCNVRKHVERASDDPNSFITTYEGKHNHEMPLKTTNSVASEPDSQGASGKDKL